MDAGANVLNFANMDIVGERVLRHSDSDVDFDGCVRFSRAHGQRSGQCVSGVHHNVDRIRSGLLGARVLPREAERHAGIGGVAIAAGRHEHNDHHAATAARPRVLGTSVRTDRHDCLHHRTLARTYLAATTHGNVRHGAHAAQETTPRSQTSPNMKYYMLPIVFCSI